MLSIDERSRHNEGPSPWLEKNNEGWRSISMLTLSCLKALETFFWQIFSRLVLHIGVDFEVRRTRRVDVKVLGKCLSRLETLHTTPPLFLQLNFLLRLKMGEYWL